jgi:hypothetical protein
MKPLGADEADAAAPWELGERNAAEQFRELLLQRVRRGDFTLPFMPATVHQAMSSRPASCTTSDGR